MRGGLFKKNINILVFHFLQKSIQQRFLILYRNSIIFSKFKQRLIEMRTVEEILLRNFPFAPSSDQANACRLLGRWLDNRKDARTVFLLKGYAGTGKTTLLSVLIQSIKTLGDNTTLMAPTGRAAKVLASYSDKKAFTIHKSIYTHSLNQSGQVTFKRKTNTRSKTIFIVDESSMIPDSIMEGRDILLDLIEYVFEKPGNKLLLVGDTAQLPPVHQQISSALDEDKLQYHYHTDVVQTELKQVIRQQAGSGILHNATLIRQEIEGNIYWPKLDTSNFSDIYKMSSKRMEDGLRYVYDKFGIEETIILCLSNKSAFQYNKYIRNHILSQDGEIEAGDRLIVVKNNYTVLNSTDPAGFVANGDILEVQKIRSFEKEHDFQFANVTVKMIDYPKQHVFDTKIILNTLYSPEASLSQEESKRLYQSVMLSYKDVKTGYKKLLSVKEDPYFNALQVKFAYALTCHKSQGGQWDAVFVEHGFLRDDREQKELLRWVYTAITRAKKELYLIDFDKNFF